MPGYINAYLCAFVNYLNVVNCIHSSMKIHLTCPLCNSPALSGYAMDLKRKGIHISRSKCKSCKIVFANPMAEKEELFSFYQDYYEKGNFKMLDYKEKTRREIDELKKDKEIRYEKGKFIYEYKTHGKVLDVGAGLGSLLIYVDPDLFEMYATEFDQDAIDFLKDNVNDQINVFKGDLFDAGYPDEYFDYVIFNHVIEHVLEPLRYLQEIKRILKKGGKLYIGTPNIESPVYKLYRTGMFYSGKIPDIVEGIEHTFVFSKNTLKEQVEMTGFIIQQHRSVKLQATWQEIFCSGMSLKKKLARLSQTIFSINQEMICMK